MQTASSVRELLMLPNLRKHQWKQFRGQCLDAIMIYRRSLVCPMRFELSALHRAGLSRGVLYRGRVSSS